MGVVFDFSYAHGPVVAVLLRHKPGELCDGVMAYAGCNDTGKNITKNELHGLLNAGYRVGLVIENNATDAIGGHATGVAQGGAILAAAQALDYDWRHCVLSGGYDTDAHPGDYRALDAYMAGFASIVPVPGYYGDSDSIDYIHQHSGRNWFYWQSESGSFSPKHPTPNAHLWQQYNDPRSHGLDVDVNDVLRTPLPLMSKEKDVDLNNPADVAKLTQIVGDAVFHRAVIAATKTSAAVDFGMIVRGDHARSVALTPQALTTALAAKLAGKTGLTQADVQSAVEAVFAQAGGQA